MVSVRELRPGMGLRKMYEQFSPGGIGRDAFISLGLREGYRLKNLLDKPHRTTFSIKVTGLLTCYQANALQM